MILHLSPLASTSLPSSAGGLRLFQSEITEERKINPKRMQREINNQLQNKGMGTKAQQALKLQHEQNKMERKVKSKEQREAEKERQYALRQEKRKAKHRGK